MKAAAKITLRGMTAKCIEYTSTIPNELITKEAINKELEQIFSYYQQATGEWPCEYIFKSPEYIKALKNETTVDTFPAILGDKKQKEIMEKLRNER